MHERIAFRLMREHDNLYENFVRSFQVKFEKLVIPGYHTHDKISLRELNNPKAQTSL